MNQFVREQEFYHRKPNFLGHHVILEFYGCNSNSMTDPDIVKSVFRQAAKLANCTIVMEEYKAFEPYGEAGVSGMTIIAESHFSIHSWPEHQYAAIDLFYCGGDLNIPKAVEYLIEHFEPKHVEQHAYERGFDNLCKIFSDKKL